MVLTLLARGQRLLPAQRLEVGGRQRVFAPGNVFEELLGDGGGQVEAP